MSRVFFGREQNPTYLLRIAKALRNAKINRSKFVLNFSNVHDFNKYFNLVQETKNKQIKDTSSEGVEKTSNSQSSSSFNSEISYQADQGLFKNTEVDIAHQSPNIWYVQNAFPCEFEAIKSRYHCQIEPYNNNFRVSFNQKVQVDKELLNQVRIRLNLLCSRIRSKSLELQWKEITYSQKIMKNLHMNHIFLCPKMHSAWARSQDISESQFNRITSEATFIIKRVVVIFISQQQNPFKLTRMLFCKMVHLFLESQMQKIAQLYQVDIEKINRDRLKCYMIHGSSTQHCKTVEADVRSQLKPLILFELKIQAKQNNQLEELFQKLQNFIKIKYKGKILFQCEKDKLRFCFNSKKVKKINKLKTFLAQNFKIIAIILSTPRRFDGFLQDFLAKSESLKQYIQTLLEYNLLRVSTPKIKNSSNQNYLSVLEEFRQKMLGCL